MSTNSKGFTPIILIFVIVIAAALGFVGFTAYRSFKPVPTPQPSGLLLPEPKEVPATVDESPEPSAKATNVATPTPNSCNKECQNYIDSKINQAKVEIINTLQSQVNRAQPISLQTTTAGTSTTQPKEVFVPFGSGGSTQASTWTDAAGTEITFSPSNYPGAKAFYFQASLVSDAPDRQTYARIYDVTHSVGVVGSDIEFAGLTSTLKESAALSFQSGVTKLKVQVRGLNVNLATVQNPRIKVVY